MLVTLLLTAITGWIALALLLAVGIGRSVRIAEERERGLAGFVPEVVLPVADSPARRLTLVGA